MEYSSFNRFVKSDALEKILSSIHDGTFHDFVDDWKWIFSFSKRYRGIIVFYTLVGIFGSSLSLVSSYIGRMLINIVVGQEREQLGFLIGMMLGMTAFNLVLSAVSSRISAKISIYVNNDIQSHIFEHILDARWKELGSYPSGDLLHRFNNDVGTIASNAIGWIPNLIVNIYTFVITFVVLFRLDSTMAWIAILSAPFLLLMSRRIMRRQKEYRKRVLELNSGMMSFEVETFYNFETIKSFGVFGHYAGLLKSWQKKYKDYNLDYNRFQIKTNILLTLVRTVVGMAAFGYCLYRLWTGQILYGDMTFFLQQRSSLSSRFNSLVGTIPGMLNSAISAHRIRELMELPRRIQQAIDMNWNLPAVASRYASQSLFFIGRNTDYAVALEGALKMKEISYLHAESYAAGELKHGTIALIEENQPVIAVCCNEALSDKTLSNIVEVKARGAKVLALAFRGNKKIVSQADDVIFIPRIETIFSAVLAVVPLQLLAYYAAKEKGCDIDKPKNLAKSVTVE